MQGSSRWGFGGLFSEYRTNTQTNPLSFDDKNIQCNKTSRNILTADSYHSNFPNQDLVPVFSWLQWDIPETCWVIAGL